VALNPVPRDTLKRKAVSGSDYTPICTGQAVKVRPVRGRSQVMAMLTVRDPPLWPTSVEVRDDQIYRWQEPN
jgi:hypothetical protein